MRPTEANAGAQITVEVTGPEGRGLGGVAVRVVGPDGGVQSLRTGAGGEAVFTADRQGDWRVETVGTPLALRAMLPIRPETPPGTGLWLVPALLVGLAAGWRLWRRPQG